MAFLAAWGFESLSGEEMKLQGKAGEARFLAGLLLALGSAALAAGCTLLYPDGAREVAKLPVRVEVEGPPYLRVVVTDWRKRPLAAGEMSALERAGFRWDYTVQITDTAGQTVQFREVTASVRSLTDYRSTRTFPLESRVDPHGTVPITIHAHLSTSNPDEPGNLTGVQELTFLGRDENWKLVELVVRVPLN